LIFITQKEYLCAFVKEHFKDGLERKKVDNRAREIIA
jgi:hypothetical protein